jgi:hypothetical protein
MLVTSDFLGYINRKKENEKKNSPLVTAALKTAPGGKEKNEPVEQISEKQSQTKNKEDIEYLNNKSSIFDVVL